MSEQDRCPECLAYGGFHTWLCRSIPYDQKVAHLEWYANTFLNGQERYRKAMLARKDMIAALQGKCAVLKHENNRLRRKLYRQIPETEEISRDQENNPREG